MEIKTPYDRSSKTRSEQYNERQKRINETQNWIFGNNFGKQTNGPQLNNNNINFPSSSKTVTDNNLYKNVSYDKYINNNLISSNQQMQSQINQLYNLNQQNYIQNNLFVPSILPVNNMMNNQISHLNFNPNNYSLNNLNIINGNNNINNAFNSFMDLDPYKKDIQKMQQKENYRKELLKQIEENELRKNIKKREMDELNRIEEIKNQEYFLLKEKQEEEYERIKKLNKNRKLKSQFSLETNLLNISNDKLNNSNNQFINNSSLDNEEQKEKDEGIQKISNNYQKIVSGKPKNLFEEKEELKNYIDNEYQDLFQTVKLDIDNQKYSNQNNLLLNSYELPQKYFSNSVKLNPSKNYNLGNNNYGGDLKLSNYERNLLRKNKMKKYHISNDIISKRVNNEYNFIFNEISNLNNLSKNYKMEIK